MKLSRKIVTVAVAAIATVVMTAVSVTPASAAVVLGADGLWYGNICQTSIGWQVVPWRLVGASCYSPGWGQWGYIANY
jgi:hypothetical protein